jgi:hypothetical protein
MLEQIFWMSICCGKAANARKKVCAEVQAG